MALKDSMVGFLYCRDAWYIECHMIADGYLDTYETLGRV